VRILKFYYPDNHRNILIGDTHVGSILFDEDGYSETLSYILSLEDAKVFFMGDTIEAKVVNDPHFSFVQNYPRPMQQQDRFIELTKPIANNLEIIITGNHEWKLWRFGNIPKAICSALSNSDHQVRQGTYSCVVEVYREKRPDQLMYKMFLAHGKGLLTSRAKDYQQRMGNMRAALKWKLQQLMGDCLIMAMGHTHKLLVIPPTEDLFLHSVNDRVKQGYLSPIYGSIDYIDPDRRWYCNTGSYRKLYSDRLTLDGDFAHDYAEMNMYWPNHLGFVEIIVKDCKPEFVMERRLKTITKPGEENNVQEIQTPSTMS